MGSGSAFGSRAVHSGDAAAQPRSSAAGGAITATANTATASATAQRDLPRGRLLDLAEGLQRVFCGEPRQRLVDGARRFAVQRDRAAVHARGRLQELAVPA